MERFERLFEVNGTEDVSRLRRSMEEIMVASFGLFRQEDTMQDGLARLQELVRRYERVRLRDSSLVFNSELVRALELGFMLDVALACAVASLARQESRGSHYRFDYPAMDNQRFLKHSLITRDPHGELALSYKDVTVIDTRPLDEIKY